MSAFSPEGRVDGNHLAPALWPALSWPDGVAQGSLRRTVQAGPQQRVDRQIPPPGGTVVPVVVPFGTSSFQRSRLTLAAPAQLARWYHQREASTRKPIPAR